MPTPGAQPHDLLAYPDGSIWYTGHMANVLGRLDPRTSQFKEYHPDTLSSGPRGLVAGRDGNIAMAESGMNRVALVEVKSRRPCRDSSGGATLAVFCTSEGSACGVNPAAKTWSARSSRSKS